MKKLSILALAAIGLFTSPVFGNETESEEETVAIAEEQVKVSLNEEESTKSSYLALVSGEEENTPSV